MAKQDRTDWWSRAQVIGGILTPIVIAGATGYINHQIAERARQEELQRDKLSRLALVPSFIDALTGDNEKKRVLAVRVISQVLPNDAPALLDGVIEARPNTLEAEIAQHEIRLAPFRQLAAGVYAASYSDRSSAFRQFLASPGAASDKIAVLLDQIRQSPWHLDGTANAWRLLLSFDGKDLVPFLERIRVLEHLTKGNGPQTESLARRVRIKAETAVSH